MKLNLFLLSLLNLVMLPVQAASEYQVNITEAQIANLAIATNQLQAVTQVPLLSAPGMVIVPPNQDYSVSAALAGLVSKLNVAVGDHIQQGQVLALIDSPDLLALQRQYLQTASDLQLTGAIYRRDQQLLAEGVIANSRFEQTRNQYNLAKTAANESAQLLRIAGISDKTLKQLASGRGLGSQLAVHSPINGVVLEKTATVGTRVNAQAPLYRVVNIDTLWLEINVPQERIGDIKVGDRVKIGNTSVVAEITLLGHSVDPRNQTILTRAVINSASSQVRPGQSVNTQIIKTVTRPTFKVPNEAIAQREGRFFIFVRNAEGFGVYPVEVIGKQNTESFVSGDLTGKEMIAIRGGVALKAKWLGLGSEE
ncbi:MAG: efflux RND transporter periplasmic adaptor subunit [Gammaproteobacteria bacterium HGW-Gammaproteobacteria-3]|nr:MAG: efflux RND transporter periplasmic adaptor subunit [Gammaproteobacteria bacterium HGW-Gammaproteobacteria-3]